MTSHSLYKLPQYEEFLQGFRRTTIKVIHQKCDRDDVVLKLVYRLI